MSDIIAAVATGHSACAIGILRLSGPGCIEAAGQVFTPKFGSLERLRDRNLTLGFLRDKDGRVIDEVLLTVSHAPNSYTGEDTAEFQCHGSPAVLAAGLEALFAHGVRQAGPGEFTKRAFLNGRMDLTQAEAVIDLIDAESADAAANAAGQLGGAMLRRIAPVYDRLTDVMAHFHAVLDYPDEDIDPFTLSAVETDLWQAGAKLRELLATYGRGQVLRRGLRAVILGKPNTGKSSLLNLLAGYDRRDTTSVKRGYIPMGRDMGKGVQGLTIGLPREMFAEGLSGGVRKAVTHAARVLEGLGAKVKEIDLPSLAYALPAYYVLSSAEASSNLARFDGVRYGHRAAEYANLEELYVKSRSEGFGPEVKRRILLGTYTLSAGYFDAYYKKALQVRTLVIRDFDRAFEDCDALLGPVAPTTAYRIGEKSMSPLEMYLGDVHTVPVNIAGIPALSMPCGADENGLPVGLQLMGKTFSEPMLYRIGGALEEALGCTWKEATL